MDGVVLHQGDGVQADALDVSLKPAHVLGEDTTGGVLDVTKSFGALAAFDDGTKIERLPEVVYVRLEAIQALQEEFDELHRQHVEELKALELKYFERYLPVVAKRSDIVSGRIDPAMTRKQREEEVEARKQAEDLERASKLASMFSQKLDLGDDDGVSGPGGADGGAGPPADDSGSDDEVKVPEPEKLTFDDITPSEKVVTGIPGFWLQVLKNHQEVSQLIMPHDEDSLKYLVDVRIEFLRDMQGFRVVLHYQRNPYFLNSEINKEYYIRNFMRGEQVLLRVGGTAINWKRGKNLTIKRVKKKTKRGKTVVREQRNESFYHFFYDPQVTSVAEEEDEEEVHQQIDADFELGLSFKDQIVPNAFRWYTGEACDSSDDEISDEAPDDADDTDDDASTVHTGDEAPPELLTGAVAGEPVAGAGAGAGAGVGSDEEVEDDIGSDAGDLEETVEIKQALKEAFVAKTQGKLGVPPADGIPDVEKPDDCRQQ